MNATERTESLLVSLQGFGIYATAEQAETLRRAAQALQKWAEHECGDGNEYASWAIERDEKTGVPYKCIYPHTSNQVQRQRVQDREASALARVRSVCQALGCHFYHQTDPRGCSLYVGLDKLDGQNYHTKGVPCAV